MTLAPLDEHEELELLREAVDASNNVIVITDPTLPDNPVIFLNKGFEALTGYTREEALGRNCRFLQAEDRDQPGVHRLREAISRGEFVCAELRNYRKDGTMFWNELYLSPVYRGTELRYFFGVQNDVTSRKEAELSNQQLAETGEQLKRAIETAMRDASWFSHRVLEQLAIIRAEGSTDGHNVMAGLSERERQVLERLAMGVANQAIADELGLATQTVRNYISSIYDKLGVHSRAEAIVWARERGLT